MRLLYTNDCALDKKKCTMMVNVNVLCFHSFSSPQGQPTSHQRHMQIRCFAAGRMSS